MSTTYNVTWTEAYNRVQACITCYNVIQTAGYNRFESCSCVITYHNISLN